MFSRFQCAAFCLVFSFAALNPAYPVTLRWTCEAENYTALGVNEISGPKLDMVKDRKGVGPIIIGIKVEQNREAQDHPYPWNQGKIFYHSGKGSFFDTGLDFQDAQIFWKGFFEAHEGYTKESNLVASWERKKSDTGAPEIVTLTLWQEEQPWRFQVVTSRYRTDDTLAFLKKTAEGKGENYTRVEVMTGTCVKQ